MSNNNSLDLRTLRENYSKAALDEVSVASDPLAQFIIWFEQAQSAQLAEPNAMSLATADVGGRPSSRIVLLKHVDQDGFVFYTNYDSDKGQQIAANSHVALLFHWQAMERQVRITGVAQKTSASQSEAYFQSRPLASRIGAWASAQSRPLKNRQELEAREQTCRAQFGEHPPCPPNWGGYLVVPERIEFWQGRQSRLHDRLVYQLSDGAWARQRLSP